MGLNLKGSQDSIIAEVAKTYPEIGDILARVRKQITPTKRAIAEYQAAALYAAVRPLRGSKALILEIGTAQGYSAAIMSEAAPDAVITTLNPMPDEAAVAVKNLQFYRNVHVLVEKSWDFLKAYKGPRFNFIFVDGDHKRVRLDLPWWDHLTDGGIFFFHDYSPAGTYRQCPPVFEALNEFRESIGKNFDYLVVDDGGVGMAGFTKGTDKTPRMVAGERAYDLGQCAGASILSYNQIAELYKLGQQVAERDGAIVECGVTNGGSAAALYCGARASLKSKRPLYLYDNFKGTPRPDDQKDGGKALLKWGAAEETQGGWCKGELDKTRELFKKLKIPAGNTIYAVKDFDKLADKDMPKEPVVLLHIDATVYQSTKEALEKFEPYVAPGGIVTISAYGHWQGVRLATNEYFAHFGLDAATFPTIDTVNIVWHKPA